MRGALRPRRAASLLAVLAALAALTACGERARRGPGPAREATVILVSLDGTTAEALREAPAPALLSLAERGVLARGLVPVFPTNTFPNHVSLVTGVAPEVHGIVGNVFRDPERGLYRYSDDPTWIEVEPIWAVAERHGVVSASFHWVGSQGAWRNGRGPRYWKAFDPATPEREKVDQVLAWLDMEDAHLRPRLVTTWFQGADRAAHRSGPGSQGVHRTLREQDRALARLLEGLERRGALAHTTVIVVSDHGMAEVEESVDLAAALDEAGSDAEVLGGGGCALLGVPGGPAEVDRAVAVARQLGLEAWARGEAPAELRLGHRRFGDAIAIAPLGRAIARSPGGLRGAHGYRPDAPGMHALFAAVGRGVSPGVELGEVRALDVAPTALALLGVPVPDWMEGRPIPALASQGSTP